MMKSAIMKDLYSEIERLKQGIHLSHVDLLLCLSNIYSKLIGLRDCSEVYAAREKNGIYIPKERYAQEEAEKKVQFLLTIKCHSHFKFYMIDTDFILYRILQAMAEKIEQMEVDGEAKDKVCSSNSKDYCAVLSLLFGCKIILQ